MCLFSSSPSTKAFGPAAPISTFMCTLKACQLIVQSRELTILACCLVAIYLHRLELLADTCHCVLHDLCLFLFSACSISCSLHFCAWPLLPLHLLLLGVSCPASILDKMCFTGPQVPGPPAASAPHPSSSGAPYGLAPAQQPDHMGPSQPPHDVSHDPRMGLPGQVRPQQQHWGAPQRQPLPATGWKP